LIAGRAVGGSLSLTALTAGTLAAGRRVDFYNLRSLTTMLKSLGYSRFSSGGLATVKNLGGGTLGAIPAGANYALISVEGQSIRWRDDSTGPTATNGMLAVAGSSLFYQGSLADFQMVETAAGAVVDVTFYRQAG
jgi:hypothetical protein